MADIKDSISEILGIDGSLAAALVDYESGMVLGEGGSGIDMELAAAGNSEIVKAKLKTMANLGLNEEIEDILITLDSQYHIIRPIHTQKGLFFYVALDKGKANLALARRKILNVEQTLTV